MTDTVTAPSPPEATAIEPERVLVLTDREQRILLDLLPADASTETAAIRGRIAWGDEYSDEKDELARVTLRKRRLEAEVRRCNRRLEDLEETVVEQLIDQGVSSVKHAGTGATLRIDSKIWAKLAVDTEGLPKSEAEVLRAEAKAKAGDGLIAAGLGTYVRSDFNLNSVTAHFREQIKAYRAAQADLPEDERRPMSVEDFLPPELQGLLELTDQPTISVRSGS